MHSLFPSSRVLLPALLFLAFSGCRTAQVSTTPVPLNTLTPEEQRAGWQQLFNGRDMAGWHTYGRDRAGAAWKVEDSALYLDAPNKARWQPGDGGDLLTDEAFENFELRLDWKVSVAGNSGVFVHVQEEPGTFPFTWQSGIEVQVIDNNQHPDGRFQKHRAGDLYDLVAAKEAARPAGAWNQMVIRVEGERIRVHLNGQDVLSATLWDGSWEGLIAASKFRDYKGFGRFRKGRIALQDHGDAVWYRNIRIRRL
jgi:hypothetical protein